RACGSEIQQSHLLTSRRGLELNRVVAAETRVTVALFARLEHGELGSLAVLVRELIDRPYHVVHCQVLKGIAGDITIDLFRSTLRRDELPAGRCVDAVIAGPAPRRA